MAEGSYLFTATTDDGMRVYIDDKLVLDSWYDSQVHTAAVTVNLTRGDHVVKVEYYDAGGESDNAPMCLAVRGPMIE